MPMVTETNVFNLSSYCEAQQSSFFSTYSSTELITSTITDYQGFDDTGDQTGSVVSQTYSTRTITYTERPNDAYANGGAKPPCCSTCRISAGTIQFYWWPDLATATAGSITVSNNGSGTPVTAVAPNGFTFTSPSVYMAFSSLYAQNRCSTVGDVWYNTTIGFHPNEITTVNAYVTTFTSYSLTTEDGTTESEFITAGGYRPPPSPLHYSDLAKNCSSEPGYVYFPDDPQNDLAGSVEQDPCHPILQLPDSLISMRPEWVDNHCRAAEGFGAYDPPQASTAAAAEVKPTLAPAQPGSTGTSNSAPATSTFTAQPDTTPTSSADTSSAAPPPASTPSNGGQSSSSSPVALPSPVVASSESALEPAQSESATLLSPAIQSTASELQTPSRTATDAVMTSSGGQQLPSPNTPQVESSQAAIIAPGNVDTTTQIVGQAPASQIIQETTSVNGQFSVVTEVQQQPTQAADGAAVGPAVVTTVLEQTTLVNGQATVVSSIIPAPNGGASQQGTTQVAVVTVGGQTFTADASSNFVVNDQTISANGATVTINNTPVALLSGGQTAVVGGSTVSIAVTPAADNAASITVGTNVLKANTEGGYVVSPDTTLSIGGSSVTVDNTAYALKTNEAGETMLVAGAAATSTSSANIGHYILSAINGQNETSSSSSSSAQQSHTSSKTTSPSTSGGNRATSASASVATQTAGAVTVRTSSALMLCLLALLAMI
ncbi:hypothetical protein M409DRAFT_20209 [Zasmidium cellare ATCC 36951]|uniref:Uncharacterized protein n=1 Tax=Zasmidium cellare ATCC 36951 TaxID=1080233 RepID=A0A6A6CRK9_ZASCE|nr:uncharacterized protein M409DRAFT_20209 [Zasmidium cellare ATCC 36951]KAF2169794.1 hypothetical protein M409DRAFT_20209 [Zasmidium cellare ATCC 36951]